MNEKSFKNKVQLLAIPLDYKQNYKILDNIRVIQWGLYIDCLKIGIRMLPAFHALDIIDQLSRQTGQSAYEILIKVPQYKEIITVIDRNESHLTNDDSWYIEFKCRRCETYKFIRHSSKQEYDFCEFQAVMNSYGLDPKLVHCESCNKTTIQEVVSYTVPE